MTVVRRPTWRPYALKLVPTCTASSRVGVTTRTRIGCRAGEKLVDAPAGGLARLGDACRRAAARILDFAKPAQQPLGCLAEDRIGLLCLGCQLANLRLERCRLLARRAACLPQRFGHAPGAVLGLRKVGKEDADIGSRGLGGAIERRAMFGKRARTLVELHRDLAKPAGRLVTKTHEVADTVAAATVTGLSPSTLRTLRCRGGGPPYAKLGRRVVYRVADLRAWRDARLTTSTANERSPEGGDAR